MNELCLKKTKSSRKYGTRRGAIFGSFLFSTTGWTDELPFGDNDVQRRIVRP